MELVLRSVRMDLWLGVKFVMQGWRLDVLRTVRALKLTMNVSKEIQPDLLNAS